MSSQPTLLMMQTAPAGGASSFAASINFFIPLILMFGVFWILVFRPQQRRVKEHQAAINAVKKGDEVITGGGIRGRVTKVTDDEAEVEIASGVKVRVVKSTLTHVIGVGGGKPAND
jgi:preprotein translocase subunit YajC